MYDEHANANGPDATASEVPHRVPRRGSSAVGGPNDEEVVVVLADGESDKAMV